MEKSYTINSLAKLAGVTVRALRHYDQIGLLKPTSRSSHGHRMYGKNELLKLQQILFYKELDLPLGDIKKLLEDDAFDFEKALQEHKNALNERINQLNKIVRTIDKTILHFKENTMLKDEELYEGFTKEQIAEMKNEASEKWGKDLVAESHRKVASLSKEEWGKVKEEGMRIATDLAKSMQDSRNASSEEVQNLIHQHYMHLHNFYTPNIEMYRGLGNLYVQDPRFTATYEKVGPGLAQFIKEAIDVYCDRQNSK